MADRTGNIKPWDIIWRMKLLYAWLFSLRVFFFSPFTLENGFAPFWICREAVTVVCQFLIGCAGHIRERNFQIILVCQSSPDTCYLKLNLDKVHYCNDVNNSKTLTLSLYWLQISRWVLNTGSHAIRPQTKHLDPGCN